MTARDIVQRALGLCGIRQSTEAQQTAALVVLNDLLASWSAERLMVPVVIEESFTLTAGTAVYTIGPVGAFDTVRPMRIMSAFLRDASSVDHPLDIALSLEDWGLIADKASRRRPDALYYRPDFPQGTITFDAPPDAAYTLNLYTWKPLTDLPELDAAFEMPGEYAKVVRFSLAVDLAPEYSVALDPTVIQQATGGHVSLRNLNSQPVPRARMDPALTRALLR